MTQKINRLSVSLISEVDYLEYTHARYSNSKLKVQKGVMIHLHINVSDDDFVIFSLKLK